MSMGMSIMKHWLPWVTVLVVLGYLVYDSQSGHNFKRQIEVLEAKAKLMENNAKIHENNSMRFSQRAEFFEKQVNVLRDSLVKIKSQTVKVQQIYEDTKRNPIRFMRDAQRDSILSVLYPG